jgi:hypothetical protein
VLLDCNQGNNRIIQSCSGVRPLDFRTVTPHSGHAINKERAREPFVLSLCIIKNNGGVPRLGLLLVLGLATSPPVFEYEPGEPGGLIIGDCGPSWLTQFPFERLICSCRLPSHRHFVRVTWLSIPFLASVVFKEA